MKDRLGFALSPEEIKWREPMELEEAASREMDM
jgi:hypothetical protein